MINSTKPEVSKVTRVKPLGLTELSFYMAGPVFLQLIIICILKAVL